MILLCFIYFDVCIHIWILVALADPGLYVCVCVVLSQIAKHRPTKAIYNELVASSPLGALRSDITAGTLRRQWIGADINGHLFPVTLLIWCRLTVRHLHLPKATMLNVGVSISFSVQNSRLTSLPVLYFPLLTKVVCDVYHASVIQYTTFFNAVSLFSACLLLLKCVLTFCLTSISSCCSLQVPELEIYKRGTSQVTLVALHAGCET